MAANYDDGYYLEVFLDSTEYRIVRRPNPNGTGYLYEADHQAEEYPVQRWEQVNVATDGYRSEHEALPDILAHYRTLVAPLEDELRAA